MPHNSEDGSRIGWARRLAAVSQIALASLMAGACADNQPATPPMEQQLHANDSGVPTGERGRHAFRCDDGKPLFVDFADGGLRLDIRHSERATPTSLTAPAPGLQYVGDQTAATFRNGQLTFLVDGEAVRTCTRGGEQ